MPLARTLNETTHFTGAKAFIAWRDGRKPVDGNRKMGTQGYCMSGPIASRNGRRRAPSCRSRRPFHGCGLGNMYQLQGGFVPRARG